MVVQSEGTSFWMKFRSIVREAAAMSLDHVSLALTATGVPVAVLGTGEKQAMVLRLLERLGVDVRRHEPWDDNAAPEGRLRPDGWELIPRYVGTTTCLMFLNGANTVWKFMTGSDLLRVLKECPALEFYVCDEDASYLLCSNHHDFVVGWGVAESWVESLG